MTNLSIKDILLKSSEYLKNKGIVSSRYDTEMIISHFMKVPRMNIYLDFEKIVSQDIADLIRQAIIERGKRKPLQYILGYVYFLDCLIQINENVLIPRPETEFMVDMICKNRKTFLNILDLCSGSGAIAIALKKNFIDAHVFASDVCEKTIKIAENNAKKNNVEISFLQSDLFNVFNNDLNPIFFDLIISNPPYISSDEYDILEPEIFFEPKKALVAEKKGLYYLEKIIVTAKHFLSNEGFIYLEIGSNQSEILYQIAEKNNYSDIEIIKDLNEKNRVMRIKK
ncbi:MAG: peptide chain release factor N(5)-glutamine methyltransferase [Candidatus Cloacimonetes bacterium]|nr:peptide chain release factor N(5)-glutamine methyltransferase [Candidatus Cloacimonadota bacterium]